MLEVGNLALINPKKKEVQVKIVYYGPGRGGKTTNLEYINKKFKKRIQNEMVTVKTYGDRTLFFDFLPFDVETSICLMDKEYITKLKKSSSDNSVKILEDIMSLLDREDNNTLFLHEFDNSLSILDNAIVIADTNKNANIHLVTKNKISLNDQSYKISSNLFLHTFIKKDEFKLGKTVTSKKPLNTDIGNTIFETLIKFLALRKEVFYSENSNYCFPKIIENQQINNIENVLDLNMTSFYIEALKEEPKKLTHKYIKGEQNR